MRNEKLKFDVHAKTVITFEIGEMDFQQVFGRKPKNNKELEDFGHYCKKGVDAQLDWDIIYSSAKDAME